jgi:tetratricopeptide (TPR) repeat protein
MSTPLLVEYYNQLPVRPLRGPGNIRVGIGEDRASGGQKGRPATGGKARWRAAVDGFKRQTAQRYTTGTLLRLLHGPDPRARRAAVFALGLLGNMEVNTEVAACLRDDDVEVPALAAEALWALWSRADTPANNDELDRLVRTRERDKVQAGLDALIARAPTFAEAYNQRAILLFRHKQFERALADCERALQLNPLHFGALAGLGQCYLQLRRHKAALRAFRNALRINPYLEGVAETVRDLERALGEEGRRDEKK